MKTKELIVSLEMVLEVAEFLTENELRNEIVGTTEDDEIMISVDYEKSEVEIIDELEELIDGQGED